MERDVDQRAGVDGIENNGGQPADVMTPLITGGRHYSKNVEEIHVMLKPTPSEIAEAIAKQTAGPDPVSGEFKFPDCLDPEVHWSCDLYNPEGKKVCDGFEDTAGGAMAMAWVGAWAPNAIIEEYAEPGSVPFNIPDGWRFELTPPTKNG